MRVRFFSPFCSHEECVRRFRYTGEVTGGEDYTHAVLLNTVMPRLKVPKENVLGLAFEPPEYLALGWRDIETQPEFFEYARRCIGRYYIGGRNYGAPFIRHHAYMWHSLPREIAPVESRPMSIVFSRKCSAPGHQYRHALVAAILKSDLPIDIYGRGCDLLPKDARVKGSFTDETLPYSGYLFTIAVENYRHECYVSEKLLNGLAHGCTVLYWGGTSPYGGTIPLMGNLEPDMAIIAAVLSNPKYVLQSPLPIEDLDEAIVDAGHAIVDSGGPSRIRT